MNRFRMFLACLLLIGLGASVGWFYQYYCRQQDAAWNAQKDLQECRQMIAKIQQAQHRPVLASDHEKLASETTHRIEAAGKSAGIPPEKLLRISPQSPARAGDTPYKEKPISVNLKEVTLKQILLFTYTLTGSEYALNAKSIRLSAPRGEESTGRWDAEIVLTYLIYDPLKPM